MRLRHLFLTVLSCLGLLLSVDAALASKVDIIISKVSQKMTVKVDGSTEYVWPVSTGAAGYDTPSGNFRPFRMEADHYSKEWDDAPMPHSIFFTGQGHAIHGSFHVKSLGRKASHGCVRLAPENAAILYSLVKKNGMSNTSVTLKGGFFDFGTRTASANRSGNSGGWWLNGKPKRSFAAVGSDIEKTIKGEKKKPAKKVAMKCTVKDGKKVCRKPFVLFGGNEG
jgi:hypothetical protein